MCACLQPMEVKTWENSSIGILMYVFVSSLKKKNQSMEIIHHHFILFNIMYTIRKMYRKMLRESIAQPKNAY